MPFWNSVTIKALFRHMALIKEAPMVFDISKAMIIRSTLRVALYLSGKSSWTAGPRQKRSRTAHRANSARAVCYGKHVFAR